MQSYMGGMMQDPKFINRLVELGMQNPTDEILGSVAGSVLEQMMQPQDMDSEVAKAMDFITLGTELGDQNMIDMGQSILSKFYNYGGQTDTSPKSLQDVAASNRINELGTMINDPEMAGLKDQYMAELAYLSQAPSIQAPSGSRFYVDKDTGQYGYEPEKGLGWDGRFLDLWRGESAWNPVTALKDIFGDSRKDYRTPIGNTSDLDYSLISKYLSQ